MDTKEHSLFYSGGNTNNFGTGFLVAKQYRQSVLKFNPISDRICTLRIKSLFFNITLISAHAPTEEKEKEDKDAFYELLENTLGKIPKHDVKIILGDMNAQIGKEDTDSFRNNVGIHSAHDVTNNNGMRLIDFASSRNMVISSTCFPHKRIHKATWHSPDGMTQNQIDHVLIDKRHASDIMDVRTCRGADCDSDHFLVKIKYRQRISRMKNELGKKREKFMVSKLTKDDTARDQYQAKVSELLQEKQLSEENLTGKWKIIQESLISAAEVSVGFEKIQKRKEWYDDECDKAIKERNDARLKMLNRKTRATMNEFQEKRRIANRVCRRKKRALEKERIQRITDSHNEGDTRQMFKNVKDVKGGFQARTSMCKDESGNLLGGRDEILERWAAYFEELLQGPQEIENLETSEDRVEHGATAMTPEELPPTYEEVAAAIQLLRNNKAPGEDKITAELLKYGGEDITRAMHELIKKVWLSETMPEDWYTALICPIHKKEDKTVCKNYRGISLLSVPYKLLTKIIAARLEPLVEKIIGDYQCGFRKGKSTVDQIFAIRNILEKCNEYNVTIHQLFIDFKQAYDSIYRSKLYEVMAEFKIPPKLIQLVKMTLKNTKCKVVIQGELTREFNVTKGLRQGDSLSTTLFNLCLEKVIRSIHIHQGGTIFNRSAQNLAFADDVDLIARNMKTLSESYKNVKDTAKQLGLVINQDKTKYLTNDKKKSRKEGELIEIDEDKFEVVDQFKYLGSIVTYDNDNTVEIKARISSANRTYFSLLSTLRSSLISRNDKITIYKVMIRPIAMYGSETWSLSAADEELLNTWERKVLRKIYGAINDNGTWRIRTNKEIYDLYKDNSIVTEIKKSRLRWAGHLCRMAENKPQKKIFATKPDGTRKRGRPKKRWIDGVEEDLKKMNIKNWKKKAEDRGGWRNLLGQVKDLHGLSH